MCSFILLNTISYYFYVDVSISGEIIQNEVPFGNVGKGLGIYDLLSGIMQ